MSRGLQYLCLALLLLAVSCTPHAYTDHSARWNTEMGYHPPVTPGDKKPNTLDPGQTNHDPEVEPVHPYRDDNAFDHTLSFINSGTTTNGTYIKFYDVFEVEGRSVITLNLQALMRNFTYPISGQRSSPYGPRNGRMHSGLDLRADSGTPIYTILPGVVTYSGNYGAYGNVLVVRHREGIESLYSHNSKNLVRVGDWVKKGERVALCGRTGNASGNHLHIEVRAGGQAINPELLLDVTNRTLYSGVLRLEKSNSGAITAARAGGNDTGAHSNNDSDAQAKPDPETKPDPEPSTTEKPTDKEPEKITHTVVRGDTLWSIARKYSTTVSKLCNLNNISSSSILSLGQEIQVK